MATLAPPAPKEAPKQKAARPRSRLLLKCLTGAFVAMFVAECLRMFVGSNFHTVVPGQCYRSAQVTPLSLENAQRAHAIRSVVNLRDANEREWYYQERDACERLGVKLVNAGLSSKEQPPARDWRRFILAMRVCPEPVLIHCANGNDRTSLASAVYLLLRTSTPLPEARRQLSLRYGHLFWTKASCLGRILDTYEEWLDENRLQHAPENLTWWSLHVFVPEDLMD